MNIDNLKDNLREDFPIVKGKIRVTPKKREYNNVTDNAIKQRVIGIYQQSRITDEMIDNIRKDLQKGKITKIAIAEKYKIDRNIVTQIEKGYRVKSTEVTEEFIQKRHQEKDDIKIIKDSFTPTKISNADFFIFFQRS